MKKLFDILIIFLLCIHSIFSQNWEPICDTRQQNVRSLYVDTIDNVVFIGGAFRYIIHSNDTIDTRGIVKWDGENFDTLGYFPNFACNDWNCNPVLSVIRYKDEIYASILNPLPNEGEIYGLARWDGVKWDSVGSGLRGLVFNQIVYENELYALGRFQAGNNLYYANGIAKWDGEQWHQVNFPFEPSDNTSITILCATVFNGDLYVGGNFYNDEQTARDVARFDGENWYPVGEPIIGGQDDVSDIIVFQDELYICGDFRASSGNAGNKIMKLFNNSWTDVGSGFDSPLDQATEMIVHNDKLYVVGIFDAVGGGISAQNIAVWDGEKWCGIGAAMDDSKLVSVVEFKEDLIIAGNFDTIDNVIVSEIARWTGGDYVDTCGAIVSAKEPEITEKSFELFPNPASHDLHISITGDFQYQSITLSVFNILGERLFEERGFDPGEAVDVSGLASGTYILQLQSGEGVLAQKFVVQR